MVTYLDENGLTRLWSKITGKYNKAIKSITRSGTTFTATHADGTTSTFNQQDTNTWTAMTGATASANGTAGYAPAPPSAGYNTKYLRADGTWNVPYTHPTNEGNKHIPSGGSSGQILRWASAGTATWGADNNTTYTAGSGLTLSGTQFKIDAPLEIENGGTGSTQVEGYYSRDGVPALTLASGFSIVAGTLNMCNWGPIHAFYAAFRSTSQLAANMTVTVGTFSDYKPGMEFPLDGGNSNATAWITSEGQLRFNPGATAIAANTNFYIKGMWLVDS